MRKISKKKLPDGWKILSLGAEEWFSINMGQSPPSSSYNKEQEGLPFYQGNADFGNKYPVPSVYCNAPRKIAEKGDVLVSVRAPVGEVNMANEKCCLGRGLSAIRSNTGDSWYLYYLLNGIKKHWPSEKTTFEGIKKTHIENMKTMWPPKNERENIVRSLQTLDSAIEKANAIIEKTERIKKGLLRSLLKKGIGHQSFKQTKIGNMPNEWRIATIKEIASVKGGKRLPKGHKLVVHKTRYPYIRVTDFADMGVDMNKVLYLESETQKKISRYTISSDDVYISIAGTIGLVGLIQEELNGANLTENAAKICDLKNIDKIYLACCFHSEICKKQIRAYVGKGTQPKLALFRIEKIAIPVPSLDEQRKIAGYISEISKKLYFEKNRKQKLERIKQSLMNDLLTGKKRIKAD